MRKLLLVLMLLFQSTAFADISKTLNIAEADGSPSTYPYKLIVSNGSLTDNSDGTATLSTGSSIGGSLSGGTDGSVLFVHPGGTLAQDNANFFWDGTNHQLGIGLNSSLIGELHVDNSFGTYAAAGYFYSAGTGINALYAESFAGNALNARSTSGNALQVIASTGEAINVFRFSNQTGASNKRLLDIQQLSATDAQDVLYIKQVGTGNILNLLSGSTSKVVVDSTGRLGVGTTSPGYALDVQADTGNSTAFQAAFQNTNVGSGPQAGFVLISPNSNNSNDRNWSNNTNVNAHGDFCIMVSGSNTTVPTTGSDTRLVIESNGNVGVGTGTSSPVDKFEVRDTTASNGNFASFGRNSKRLDMYSDTAAILMGTLGNYGLGLYVNNGSNSLYLDTSGNVNVPILTASQGVGTDASKNLVSISVPTIVGTDRKTGLVAAQALATYTVGAADASYQISANVLITTATLFNFSVTCTYTDESNTSRVVTLNFSQLSGVFVTSMTNLLAAPAYEGVPLHIRAKAGTTIIIASTGTFTTVVYNLEERITQE